MKRAILLAAAMAGIVLSSYAQARLLVNAHAPKETISRHIYGHFSEHLGRCIYDGFWVSDTMQVPKKDRIRMDVVEALKKIKVPNLRWPGGCFADEYHWRDGIGPRENRPKMINSSWGNVTEDNSFGTHEFLELCSLIDCEPYISANVGSGTVQEMNNWVEYLNFDGLSPLTDLRKKNGRDKPWGVEFWGVGNESWGCGGNMTPEYYAGEYRRYATFCKNYPDARLKKIVSGANSNDYNWTEVMMKNIPLNMMWGLSLHHYTIPKNWGDKGSATQFNEREYFLAMRSCMEMETLIQRHSIIMDKYDPNKRVGLVVDEWGIWTNVEPGTNPAFLYQQNSMRDAIIAGTTLNIFNNHADRVKMAELAQTVNVLQAVILTKGRQMLLTPTYHIFDLYKVHQDAKLLPVQLAGPEYNSENDKLQAVNVSASQDASGAIHISFVNIDPNKDITIRTALNGSSWKNVTGQIITSPKFTDINTFEQPGKIVPAAFKGAKKEGEELVVTLPKLSVVVLELK
ncbi:alpha-N-arabinofuranosidase [Chitinophaga horti]|uniref:non-reducing end alpha-L-arabinofuranosidase n=1 Tax=Chitinophaga horti TaxID=2920382 RepID=A0ABY6J1Z6_9BACT|nr:alpha-L-arabinofuranosidase C-terminal domain-containing protein [Chitinophaga horti]UYQ92229.1 alpha-N-arabinofuranosidase [Chitinophaga horti]